MPASGAMARSAAAKLGSSGSASGETPCTLASADALPGATFSNRLGWRMASLT